MRITDLQKMVGWLSVRQAVKYHSLMEARRILSTKQPLYLYAKLSAALQERQHSHNTRHGARRMPRELVDLPLGGSRDKAYRARLRAWVTSDTQ